MKQRFWWIVATIVLAYSCYAPSMCPAVQIEKKPVMLQNEVIRLGFGPAAQGYAVYTLAERTTGTDFVQGRPAGPLWIIELRDEAGNLTEVTSEDGAQLSSEYSGGNMLTLTWKHITVEQEANALSVQVTVRLDGRLSRWRIAADNHSQHWGIWTVTFPLIHGLGSRDGDYCVWPRGVGRLIDNLTVGEGTYWGVYPSGGASMQFAVVGTQEASLYLGAHDPLPCVKELYLETHGRRGATYRTVHFPEDMGRAGKDFVLPFEMVVGLLDGDWIDACKVYREWVTQQDFAPPPIAEQTDLPKWFRDIAVWIHKNGPTVAGSPEEPQALDWIEFIDQPVGIHWYNWHQYTFAHFYPEYFPAKDGAAEWAQKFQDAGARLLPYINGKSWDVAAESFETERAAESAVMLPVIKGESSRRSYYADSENSEIYTRMSGASGHEHAVMCSDTELWQDKLAGLCEKIVRELGTDGVYLDMVGIHEPSVCFNPEHEHTGPAGRHAIEGFQEIVRKCKERMRAVNPETVLATEGRGEAYQFDALLAFFDTYFGPELVPMFDYVWSGYKIAYGRMAPRGKAAFPQQFAQCFVWGEQMGWDGICFEPTLQPGTPHGEYLKELARVFTEQAKRFTRYGEMLRPAQVLNEIPTGTAVWREPVTMPVILHSCWRAPDGALGLVVTNWTETAHTIEFDIGDGLRLEMGPYSAQVIEIQSVQSR